MFYDIRHIKPCHFNRARTSVGVPSRKIVHLTFPPLIFSVQVKSEVSSITDQSGASLERNKRNLTLTQTFKLLLPSMVFHDKICVFITIFTTLSFLRLIHDLFLYEEAMSIDENV